jgi:hypothetical protein
MRAALQRVLDAHRHEASRLEDAGYESPEEFVTELAGLLRMSSEDLTAPLLAALFGEPPWDDIDGRSGRLGQLLGLV